MEGRARGWHIYYQLLYATNGLCTHLDWLTETLLVIQLFYCCGNKRWCRKGRMEWEVVGGAGAGSACILDLHWFQTHNFFSFISQVKQRVSACIIIILHYKYNFHVSLFVNFWPLRRLFPESSNFLCHPILQIRWVYCNLKCIGCSEVQIKDNHTIASWTKDKTYT